MSEGLLRRARLVAALLTVLVATLLPTTTAHAANHTGNMWFCTSSFGCPSGVATTPSAGNTVYVDGASLLTDRSDIAIRWSRTDVGIDGCHLGPILGGGQTDSSGNLTPIAVTMPGPGNLTFCATNGTGSTTSNHLAISINASDGSGSSENPSTSADGRYVAFDSLGSNLVPGDTNGARDVFVRDRGTGSTTRVSVTSAGAQANGASEAPAISADGRFVAFTSAASNLVSGDTNGAYDVFLHDRTARTTSRASVSSSGAQTLTYASEMPSISADGRYVAFRSGASNLVAGDTNITDDAFVRDTATSTTTRVSLSSNGAQANYNPAGRTVVDPMISADGRYVAFTSFATTLVAGDTNGVDDVFVRDRTTATTTRASVTAAGAQASGASDSPSISGDGRYVAFRSSAANLVGGDTNGVGDVFRRDRVAGTTLRVSLTSGGAQGNGPSAQPSISSDGNYIAFQSTATDLAAGDTNGASDVLERNVTAGVTTPLSDDNARGRGNAGSFTPAISADGTTVAFSSEATNLAILDLNFVRDVLVHVFSPQRDTCYVDWVSLLGSTPTDIETQPREGQTVYRVWGGHAAEFGASWTPVDPRHLGADRYRISAGLPDRLNFGTYLTVGRLNDPSGVALVRMSLPVGPGPESGPAPGIAYRSYGGGLIEYVIPNAENPATITREGVPSYLSPAYGGVPVGCTPSIPPDRGCVDEYAGS